LRDNRTKLDLQETEGGRTRDGLVFIQTFMDSYKKSIEDLRKKTETRPLGYDPVDPLTQSAILAGHTPSPATTP
jgi:hypothetical protein